jgi:UDP-glucose 4-epimerase
VPFEREGIEFMKVLVTGGAGFIGSNIVRLLVAEGHGVTVLDNLSSGYEANLHPFSGIRFVRGDVRDIEAVRTTMEGAEAVFHLAASVGNKRSIDNPIEDSEINVLGTLKVLEAARGCGVRKVVFSSSAGIFGELKTLPISEDHPVEPDSPYGASKLCAEKMCLAYAKLYGLEVACLRYFNVYGPNQRYDAYGNVIPIFANNILRGIPLTIFGDGEQTRDFVSVHDVARANVDAAMTPKAGGVFNLGSGTRVSINQLAEMVAEAAEVQLNKEHAPPRKGDVRHSLADISRAQATFGFGPAVDLRTGLSEYVAWLKGDLDGVQKKANVFAKESI